MKKRNLSFQNKRTANAFVVDSGESDWRVNFYGGRSKNLKKNFLFFLFPDEIGDLAVRDVADLLYTQYAIITGKESHQFLYVLTTFDLFTYRTNRLRLDELRIVNK